MPHRQLAPAARDSCIMSTSPLSVTSQDGAVLKLMTSSSPPHNTQSSQPRGYLNTYGSSNLAVMRHYACAPTGLLLLLHVEDLPTHLAPLVYPVSVWLLSFDSTSIVKLEVRHHCGPDRGVTGESLDKSLLWRSDREASCSPSHSPIRFRHSS